MKTSKRSAHFLTLIPDQGNPAGGLLSCVRGDAHPVLSPQAGTLNWGSACASEPTASGTCGSRDYAISLVFDYSCQSMLLEALGSQPLLPKPSGALFPSLPPRPALAPPSPPARFSRPSPGSSPLGPPSPLQLAQTCLATRLCQWSLQWSLVSKSSIAVTWSL